MKIKATALLECELDKADLGRAVFAVASDLLDLERDFDDAGCDWATDDEGGIYIHFSDTVRIAVNREAAALIDAVHILKGYKLADCKITPEAAKTIPNIYN